MLTLDSLPFNIDTLRQYDQFNWDVILGIDEISQFYNECLEKVQRYMSTRVEGATELVADEEKKWVDFCMAKIAYEEGIINRLGEPLGIYANYVIPSTREQITNIDNELTQFEEGMSVRYDDSGNIVVPDETPIVNTPVVSPNTPEFLDEEIITDQPSGEPLGYFWYHYDFLTSAQLPHCPSGLGSLLSTIGVYPYLVLNIGYSPNQNGDYEIYASSQPLPPGIQYTRKYVGYELGRLLDNAWNLPNYIPKDRFKGFWEKLLDDYSDHRWILTPCTGCATIFNGYYVGPFTDNDCISVNDTTEPPVVETVVTTEIPVTTVDTENCVKKIVLEQKCCPTTGAKNNVVINILGKGINSKTTDKLVEILEEVFGENSVETIDTTDIPVEQVGENTDTTEEDVEECDYFNDPEYYFSQCFQDEFNRRLTEVGFPSDSIVTKEQFFDIIRNQNLSSEEEIMGEGE